MSLAADYHQTQYYQAPYRPMTRSKTTYGGMNDWMSMKAKADRQRAGGSTARPAVPMHVPVTLSDANWREIRDAPSAPYRPFEDTGRTDEYYRRYLQLSGNIAFQHPNPGYPRERQGAIGGTWRHIKEVGGYHGGQVCFVDGLVRLYDTDSKSHALNNSRSLRAALATPAYAPNRHNVNSYQQDIERSQEQREYKPWEQSSAPAINETPRQQMASGNSKYKGFYSYRQ